MFLVVLLASHVVAEWVEIAQNHYRKEPIRRVTLNHEETAETNRIYTNYSVTERSWSKGMVTRFPNIGNVQRVTLSSKTRDVDLKGSFSTQRKFSTTTKSYMGDEIKGKATEKSKGSLNFPVRHDAISESFNIKNPFQENRKEIFFDNKFQESKISNDRKHKIVNSKIRNDQNISGSVKIKVGQVAREPNLDSKTHIKENNRKDNGNTEDVYTKHTNKTLIKLENIPQTSKQPSMMHDNDNNYNDTITKLNINEINDDPNLDIKIKVENTSKGVNQTNYNKEKIDNNEKDAFQSEDHSNNNSETNTVKVIWKLMKIVTDNISKNTRRSFKSKLRYLERLRNNILSNIEARIEQAWPDDDKARVGSTRSRRAARGHVEIPSSEGALMTISFLTFAVFLIKLVLQVIHTYKNKTMMVTPTLVAAVGRAAAEYRKHAHKQN